VGKMNFVWNIWNKIVDWGKKIGLYLWMVIAGLFDLLILAGAFISKFRKPLAISAGAISFIALVSILEFILTRYVFYTFLLLVVVLTGVIIFRRSIGSRICQCWRKACKCWRKTCKCWRKTDKKLENFSKISIAAVSMILGLFALFLVWGQLQAQTDIAKRQSAAEHFKNAVEHLGSEKQPIVLGGVHALHNLAVENPKDYSKPVFEILCSFIREETATQDYKDKVEAKLAAEEESQKMDAESDPATTPSKSTEQPQTTSLIVIQTIVDKLFRYENLNENVYRKNKVNLSGAFLRALDFSHVQWEGEVIDLQNANVQGIKFCNSNLQGANFKDANLQGADLSHANLREAVLSDANLQGAVLYGAKLQGALLVKANLQGADLSHADLQEAGLSGANLQGAVLYGANLQVARLRNAHLQWANLRSANLQGADLSRADITDVKNANFTGARGVEQGEDGKWRTMRTIEILDEADD